MAQKSHDLILIEDNPDDAELVLEVLLALNTQLKCLHLHDGESADAYINGLLQGTDLRPGLVLLDLQLPKISGFTILEKLKAHKQTAAIPVVAFTSSKSATDRSRSYALGINAYVTKPIYFEDFQEIVTGLGKFWLLYNEHP